MENVSLHFSVFKSTLVHSSRLIFNFAPKSVVEVFMGFEKLNKQLVERMTELGITEPTALQEAYISKMKSGGHLFVFGPQGAGKTEALIMTVLHKLKMQTKGDNPVALIYSKDKSSVLALTERFKKYTLGTDLRVRTAYDERIINHEKDEIYAGADIVIGTPKRVSKLYFLNGINLNELGIIAVHESEFLFGTSFHTDIDRIAQSVKAQHLVFGNSPNVRFEKLEDLFMQRAQIIDLN